MTYETITAPSRNGGTISIHGPRFTAAIEKIDSALAEGRGDRRQLKDARKALTEDYARAKLGVRTSYWIVACNRLLNGYGL